MSSVSISQLQTWPVQQYGHHMRVMNSKLYARYKENADATAAPTKASVEISGWESSGAMMSMAA